MKLGESALAKVAAVIVVALFAVYVFATWHDDAEAPETALQVPTAIEGIRLGEELIALPSSHGPFDKEQASTKAKYADEENYVQRNGALRLGVRKGFVSSVGYGCREGRDRTALNNVACHARAERIKHVFNNRVRVLCARMKADDPNKDLAPFARAYDVVEYATRYIVIKDSVEGFLIFRPGELETLVGLNWEACPA